MKKPEKKIVVKFSKKDLQKLRKSGAFFLEKLGEKKFEKRVKEMKKNLEESRQGIFHQFA